MATFTSGFWLLGGLGAGGEHGEGLTIWHRLQGGRDGGTPRSVSQARGSMPVRSVIGALAHGGLIDRSVLVYGGAY
jgi:hypothetical protein